MNPIAARRAPGVISRPYRDKPRAPVRVRRRVPRRGHQRLDRRRLVGDPLPQHFLAVWPEHDDPIAKLFRIIRAERPIRKVLSECLCVEVFASPHERRLALERFIDYTNDRRPHLGIGGRIPRQRLSELMAA